MSFNNPFSASNFKQLNTVVRDNVGCSRTNAEYTSSAVGWHSQAEMYSIMAILWADGLMPASRSCLINSVRLDSILLISSKLNSVQNYNKYLYSPNF